MKKAVSIHLKSNIEIIKRNPIYYEGVNPSTWFDFSIVRHVVIIALPVNLSNTT